ncbi:hypothetical protein RB595_001897 [Gaeumannomyces hyphopodioides]
MSLPHANIVSRHQLTDYLAIVKPWPRNPASPRGLLITGMKHLLCALAEHDGMRVNMAQHYMTPLRHTADKSKVYFMYDLVASILHMIPTDTPADPETRYWRTLDLEVTFIYAMEIDSLIRDTTGRLDHIIERAHPGSWGYRRNVEFGLGVLGALDRANFQYAKDYFAFLTEPDGHGVGQ